MTESLIVQFIYIAQNCGHRKHLLHSNIRHYSKIFHLGKRN